MSGSASTPQDSNNDDSSLDPLLDFSLPEEQELPFITIGTTTALPMGENNPDGDGEEEEGETDDMKVSILNMESRMHNSYLETLLAVGIDGCKQIREILEGVVKGSNTPFVPRGYKDDDDEDM
jgi:exosome complex component RRP41